MSIKEEFNKAIASVRFAFRGSPRSVKIGEIPKVWTKFLDTEDEWINVDFPETENTSACIYMGKAGSVFHPHLHESSVEHFTILSGKVEIFTPTRNEIVSFPDSVFFDMKEPHSVTFLEDSRIMCMWHPKMEGWNAEFHK